MLSRFQEYTYMSTGFSHVFLVWLLDYLRLWRNGERQVTIEDLLQPEILSKFIKREVACVRIDDGSGVSRGAGGTGTSRAPLWVTLRNGEELHLFVKTPTTSLLECAFFTLFRVYENEVNFYANHFTQLNVTLKKDDWDIGPRVHYSKNLGYGKFMIILEDPRFRRPSGAVFKTTLERPFSIEGGRTVIELLANMHAVYWNDAPKDVWHNCPRTGNSLGTTPPFLLFLAYSGMKKVDTEYGKHLNIYPDVRDAFFLGMRHYHELRAYWSSGKALTMCHGDAHMGNVFVDQTARKAGFIDFQCVAVEHCMRDVSYHLVNSVPAEELEAIEEGIIRQYLAALKEGLFRQGKGQYVVDVPDYEEAYFQYRLHAFWSLIAWVMCCGFAGVVMQDFAVRSLQRALDSCHRLNVLDAVQTALRRRAEEQKQQQQQK